MATVRVIHDIDDLANDLASIPGEAIRKGASIVRKNGRRGTELARQYARELSGPHGLHYYKRITGESTGALEYEYGPHAGGVPVGGGWRHGVPNTELERSMDVVGPKFADEIGDMVDGLFW